MNKYSVLLPTTVIALFCSLPARADLEVYPSDKAFFVDADIASIETFDNFPFTRTSDAQIIIDQVRYTIEPSTNNDFVRTFGEFGLGGGPTECANSEGEFCWFIINETADRPALSSPNYLCGNFFIEEPVAITFGPQRAVRDFGFYLTTGDPEFIDRRPGFLGWIMIVYETDGAVQRFRFSTESFRSRPTFFGFRSNSGIGRVEIMDYPFDSAGFPLCHDNVSRGFRYKAADIAAIDVSPTAPGNSLNLSNLDHEIPVAIFTRALLDDDAINLDAGNIDVSSLRFGPNRARTVGRPGRRFVDNDALLDLVVRFRLGDTGITCGESRVVLKGRTKSGDRFIGSHHINPWNCGH